MKAIHSSERENAKIRMRVEIIIAYQQFRLVPIWHY